MEKTSITAPIPVGLASAVNAAGCALEIAPDGVYASDAAVAEKLAAAYVGSPAELQYWQAQQNAALGAVYAGKYAAGFTYQGVPYQIDPTSLFNLDAKALVADRSTRGGPAWPDGFYWIAADNSHVPLTAAQLLGLADATDAYVTGLIVTNRAMKDAIAGAPNAAAAHAIDVTSGWPANGP